MTDSRTIRIARGAAAGLAALLGVAAPVAAGAQRARAVTYHVTQRIPLPGEGSWDYIAVDTAKARLFIARADRIMVVDQASGKLLGEIPGMNRAHGVAFDYATNHGFATSGADSMVTMFDLATLAVLKKTMVGVDDDALLYEPVTKRVFTFNGDANTASVLDPASGDLVGTIPLGGKPESGVTDHAGKIYINIADKGEIVEVDAAGMRVARRWSIAPCEDNSGIALDEAHRRLFSVCGNKLMAVSDTRTGKLVKTVPIGEGVDAAAFDPATGFVFASNGEGTMTVVHEDAPDRYRVVATIPTMPGARTMALDPKSHRAYTVAAKTGALPPAAPGQTGRRRPPMIPGSFTLLVLER
ncbi:MAG TPA: YncE family protein [Gemmatimonadaceae bacterium]|nr:YncE family protein [Gemmatimonadaceae bacterium]